MNSSNTSGRFLRDSRFDVIVVGGGALGCAMAWESTSRGLRTALLESTDFGSGTSANSLRILHGGLRYLQNLDVVRARRSIIERATMLRLAPHLNSPLKCAVPTLSGLKKGRLAFAIGLGLNRVLSAGQNRTLPEVQRLKNGGLLTASALADFAPGLSMQSVTGGAFWFDGSMASGQRMALAFVQTAFSKGASAINHVEVQDWISRRGKVQGVLARDKISDDLLEVFSAVVIDCRGVRMCTQPALFPIADIGRHYVRAANIIVENRELSCAIGAPTRLSNGSLSGGGMIFAHPGSQRTAVGTWYFPAVDLEARLAPDEIVQILRDTNASFPGWRLTSDDIIDTEVGFLPKSPLSSAVPTPIDRPTLCHAADVGGPFGLWHAQTEKWTTVRAFAEKVIDATTAVHNLVASPSGSSEILLCGGEPLELTPAQSAILDNLQQATRERLESHYGGRLGKILDAIAADSTLAAPLPGIPSALEAELHYIAREELARTSEDVVRRLEIDDIASSLAGNKSELLKFIRRKHLFADR